jgi:DUF4097 and DUF4098 domain-containing protein YvlB
MRRLLFPVLLTVAALATPAVALEIDETRPAAPDGTVQIELIAGRVQVEVGNDGEVHVTGTLNEEFEELEFSSDGGDTTIEVDLVEGRHRFRSAADLRVRVPAGSRLEIETVSADLEIDGVRGAVSLESVSGRITIRGASDELYLESVSGSIDIETDAPLRRGEFETVSSDLKLSVDLARNGRLDVESVNGDVTLLLPASVEAGFSVETFSGDIDNEFGPRATKTSEYVPSKRLEFSTGSGDARVTVEAFSGTVRLRKR